MLDPVQVSVVIVAWNSKAHLSQCVTSLIRQSFNNFEIVLVDNGSTDAAVEDLHPGDLPVRVLIRRLSENAGFAAASNLGAGLARGKWLVLLNPDAFPEADWLEQLLKAAHNSPETFFSSRQIQANRPDLLDGEGDEYHVSGLAWRRNYGLPVYSLAGPREVFGACGAAAMYPRQAFLEAGGFDEDFFAYHEDVDLAFRLRLRGLRCVFVPQAVVHHVGSSSYGKRSDFSIYHGHRNLVWTYVKDMPALLFWSFLPLHLLVNVIFLAWFALTGHADAIWNAKTDAVRGLGLMLRKRRGIQRAGRVRAAEILRSTNRNLFAPVQFFLRSHRNS